MATIFKLERIKANMKQLELSRKTGLHPGTISLIENGWREPTPEEIKKLSRILPGIVFPKGVSNEAK